MTQFPHGFICLLYHELFDKQSIQIAHIDPDVGVYRDGLKPTEAATPRYYTIVMLLIYCESLRYIIVIHRWSLSGFTGSGIKIYYYSDGNSILLDYAVNLIL